MGKARRDKRRASKAQGGASSNVLPLKAPPKGELGASGTINWSGQIYSEANTKLQWERAYGTYSSTTWGAWEKLERTDHQVAAALNAISAPLRDSVVDIEAASEDERDVDIADFVRDNLTQWLEPLWPQLIEQQVRYGLGYGFHLGETVWGVRPDERVKGGQAVYLKKLAQRLPSSVLYNGWVEKNGQLSFIRQAGYRDGKYHEVELPANKVLLCTWNKTGDNYQGFSAFRPIWYLAQMRADLLRVLAIGHQRESCGVPVAETEKDTVLSDAQREELQEILEDLVYHENAGIQLPPGVSMKWVFSPGANKGNVLDTWKALGLAILEVVQAQGMFLGTSDTGSRAVGEVHAQSQTAFVAGVRAWLEGCWNGVGDQPYTGVIKKLVDFNFGAQKKYPLLKLTTKKGELPPTELAAAVATLKQVGALTLTADDENDFRERLGMRPIDAEQKAEALPGVTPEALPDGEQAAPVPGAPGVESVQDTALNGAQVSALLEVIASVVSGQLPRDTAVEILISAFQIDRARAERLLGSVGKGFKPDEHPEQRAAAAAKSAPSPGAGGEEDPEDETPDGSASLSRLGEFVPYRALRPEEECLNLTELDGFLDETTEDAEASMKAAVAKLIAGLLPQVEAALADGNPSELRSLKLDTEGIAKAVDDAAEKARAFGYSQSAKERKRGTGKVEKDRSKGKPGVSEGTAKLDDKGDDSPAPKGISPEKALEAHAEAAVDRVASRVKAQVWAEANRVAARGDAAESVVETVAKAFEDSKVLKGEAGGLVNVSFGIGRSSFLIEHRKEAESVLYSAILDEDACSECRAEDGKEFPLFSAQHLAHETPYPKCKGKDRCRCLLLPQWK